MVRVFAIDDNAEFLKALEYMLKLEPSLAVLDGSSWDHGLGQAAELQPDLVLMDVVSPFWRGVEAIRRVKALPHGPRVIVLSLYDQIEYRRAVITAGADGFLSKFRVSTQLTSMIRQLFFHSGEIMRPE